MPAPGSEVERAIYSKRFSDHENQVRAITWEILCSDFFQRYVRPSDTVLDIGAGEGLFLKNIRCGRKIAVDSNADIASLQALGIESRLCPAPGFAKAVGGKVDVVFMSNFLEHLRGKWQVLEVFAECLEVLKPGGLLMILQPNIRYTGPAYWDYIDHHIAITERSLVEGLSASGFAIQSCIPRFLPYSVKSRLGNLLAPAVTSKLVRAYLRFPALWRMLGSQTFVVAAAPLNQLARGSYDGTDG